MTTEHVCASQRMAPAQASRVDLLMRYTNRSEAVDVPDPWYGNTQDFIEAFDMIEAGVNGLLQHWSGTPP